MKFGVAMLVGSVLSAVGIVTALRADAGPEPRLAIWLGMAGPLAAALASMAALEWVYRVRPEASTAILAAAFAAKMIFFGVYVAVIVKGGWVQPVPFAISFAGYYLVLHVTEAVWLKRRLVRTD